MQFLAVQVPTPKVQGGLRMQTSKRGTPLKSGYFTNIGSSSMKKQLHIGTDILHIITSTSDELLRGISIDDLE